MFKSEKICISKNIVFVVILFSLLLFWLSRETKSDNTNSSSSDENPKEKPRNNDSVDNPDENMKKYLQFKKNNNNNLTRAQTIFENEDIQDKKFVKLRDELKSLLEKNTKYANNIYIGQNFFDNVPLEEYQILYDLYHATKFGN